MALKLTESFITTSVPGAYSQVLVKSDPVGVAASGVIAIIGEADGGDDFTIDNIKENFFGPTQVDRVTQKYVSGNIVNAMRMMPSPSADADITGAPTRVYILKTNASTAASAVVASYGTITAKVSGADGNKIKYEITQIEDEIAPSLEGDTISNFAALAGVVFHVRLNGAVATVVDVFTGDPDTFDTIGEVVALIDAALPAGMSCSLGAAPDSIKLSVDEDLAANDKGWGKSFELVEVTVAGLVALGVEEGLFTSALEPRIQIDIKRSDINLNESFAIGAEVALSIGYDGTTALLTKTPTTITTTVAGGSGSNLSINLSQFLTVKDLAEFIAAQPGYSSVASSGSAQSNPSILDNVAAIGIATSNSELPGRIKKAVSNFASVLSTSSAVNASQTAIEGLPAETPSPVFLSGGAKGHTTAASIAAAIDQLKGINVNFVVPLFSQNASEDIAEGLTESGSTYTISAINALVRNHCLEMSTTKNKKNRSAYVSLWGTYQQAKNEASSVSHFRKSLAFQKVSQVDAQGEIRIYHPWMGAVNAAAMQAAGFYKSIVNKFANIISFEDPEGYDSGNIDDQEDALNAGLLPLTQDIVGNKWLSDQTTYQLDENLFRNSSQMVYVADLLALDLTASIQRAFVGKSLADVDESTIIGFVISKADAYKRQKLIAPSDDAPAGFKNLKVAIRGAVGSLAIEFKPSNSLYFFPITISLSEIVRDSEA